MAKADVLSLVNTLAGDLSDAVTVERTYRELVDELTRTSESMVTLTLVAHTTGQATLTVGTDVGRILAVFFDDRQLSLETPDGLATVDEHWRDHRGPPHGYVVEDEGDQTIRLYPVPETASKAFSFDFGEPLGRDFSEYAVGVLHTERRTDVPALLELPLALLILDREFSRESDHRDVTFAQAAAELAAVFLAFVPFPHGYPTLHRRAAA